MDVAVASTYLQASLPTQLFSPTVTSPVQPAHALTPLQLPHPILFWSAPVQAPVPTHLVPLVPLVKVQSTSRREPQCSSRHPSEHRNAHRGKMSRPQHMSNPSHTQGDPYLHVPLQP